MDGSDGVKEKILNAVVELMREDTVNITVRKIAAQAGVTQGLINYHFQSKDNLINIAAQRFVDETVSRAPDLFGQPGVVSVDTLKRAMKGTSDYLARHPNVSRVSILRDLQNGLPDDNMQSSIDAYDTLLQNIIRDDRRRFLAGHIFCAAVQSFFMRANVLGKTHNIDFDDAGVRHQFVDDLIDMVFEGVLHEK